jgi:tetratricopeptide (TPR) repeat protein
MAQSLLGEARSSQEDGHLARAERKYVQALIVEPNDPEILEEYILVLLDRGKWGEAFAVAVEHSLLDPDIQTYSRLLMSKREQFDTVFASVALLNPQRVGRSGPPDPRRAYAQLSTLNDQPDWPPDLQARLAYWMGESLLERRSVTKSNYREARRHLKYASTHLHERFLGSDAERMLREIKPIARVYDREVAWVWPLTYWSVSGIRDVSLLLEGSIFNNTLEQSTGKELGAFSPASSYTFETAILGKGGNDWRITFIYARALGQYHDCGSSIEDYYCTIEDAIFANDPTVANIPSGESETYLPFARIRSNEYVVALSLWNFIQAGYGRISYNVTGASFEDVKVNGRSLRLALRPELPIAGSTQAPRAAFILKVSGRFVHGLDMPPGMTDNDGFPISRWIGDGGGWTFNAGFGLSVWL